MQNLQELAKLFASMFKSVFNEDVVSVSPLPGSGSSRHYYRIKGITQSAIGTKNQLVEENRAFLYFSDLFNGLGFNVPKVYAINDQGDCYLQTDLGDTSLFDLVQKAHKSGGISPEIIGLYRQSITQLVRFQLIGGEKADFGRAWPDQEFTIEGIKNDLLYFKYYFLKLHALPLNETKLQGDFDRLAAYAAQAPSGFFMYRDFQSRNIMVHENTPHFIDFQGGRKGPLPYDLVSLLYQVKANLPESLRQELLAHYIEQLGLYIDPDKAGFKTFYPVFIYLRLMQVLGAYGFRGLIQKKQHFTESIPYALETLKIVLEQYPLPIALPTLENCLAAVCELNEIYPIANIAEANTLVININSFSYKKDGPPTDPSGNGGGFMFDCRGLPNPGRIDSYKMLTGRDKEVIDYLEKQAEVADFLADVGRITTRSIENYISRGFTSLTIGFGCTGGQHRSVFCAEKMAAFLREKFPNTQIEVQHAQLNKI